nr:MAG TPA: hypothetical protein [Caudoviricetes sp.]
MCSVLSCFIPFSYLYPLLTLPAFDYLITIKIFLSNRIGIGYHASAIFH